MNCPSRTDGTEGHPEWNQNPPFLPADLTTRADLNGISNIREERVSDSSKNMEESETTVTAQTTSEGPASDQSEKKVAQTGISQASSNADRRELAGRSRRNDVMTRKLLRVRDVLVKYAHFVGPGFMISVAYIDPGNYSTDVLAGAEKKFASLFVVLMSNLFAIFLQSLSIKLGSVTGLNLAENCRRHLPKWLCIVLYIFAESAIVATDIAEVIGSAIALNLLLHIPLVAGCAITLVDVLVILLFYNPNGTMKRIRLFEYFVMALVLAVVICFCVQLTYIHDTPVGEVFRGYLPSSDVISGNGVYLSCGILGATVMPHSIFLGSGIVQPRLRQFDVDAGIVPAETILDPEDDEKYLPSLLAIRSCLKYSIVELGTSLFSFALFVNSAILIVAGAFLYGNSAATNADLFGIHDLLSKTIAPAAGTIFALALLLSGLSAGIVCTMAGQMVSEGMIRWRLKPWMRRLLTRSMSITPSIIIAAAVGRDGLNTALVASQACLSVILPFVTAPLIWFTCRSNIMTVSTLGVQGQGGPQTVNMRNGWIVAAFAVLIWLVLVIMNIALLVLLGLGKT